MELASWYAGRILPAVKTPFVLALSLAAMGCNQAPIGTPAGDNNYDDPDDPGQQGIGTNSDSGVPDAYGKTCVAARDCPAAFLCSYPTAEDAGLCSATGQCFPYTMTSGCDASVACGCSDVEVPLCAPPGFAPSPIQSMGACVANDASTEAGESDASTD